MCCRFEIQCFVRRCAIIRRTPKNVERCIDDDIGFTFESASFAAKCYFLTHFKLSSRFHLFRMRNWRDVECFSVYLNVDSMIFLSFISLTWGDELVSRIESSAVEDFVRFENETIIVGFRGGIAWGRLKLRFFLFLDS